jgi:citrate lyase subunit gamma (acyl carrier protein)
LEISQLALAGTLESSDLMVTVEPSDGGSIELELQSSVLNQYGRQIRKVILETLNALGVTRAKVKVVDRGALDCTIRARVECAVYRSSGFDGPVPWGGAAK